jgi:uncharacterized protein (UPF0218 family)
MNTIDFDFNYSVNAEVRKLLAKPFGFLMAGTIEENIKNAPQWFQENAGKDNPNFTIICVGDVVSNAFLKHSVLSKHIKMVIIDGMTKREKFKIDKNQTKLRYINIKNPAGMISGPASKELSELVDSTDRYLVNIDGEEDLLVLPLILLCKNNTFIVYGQPPVTDMNNSGINIPAGMVIIYLNDDLRENVVNILKKFDKKRV